MDIEKGRLWERFSGSVRSCFRRAKNKEETKLGSVVTNRGNP
jgi:hypothetical protein